jgi:TP901 family phage tail tape measure protein
MSTIGSLNVKLGLDSTAFQTNLEGATGSVGRFAQEVANQFKALEQQVTRIGVGLTAAISLPFGLMSKSAAKTSGDFESAMNKVQAALRPLSPRQLERLRAAAIELGPSVGMSATQAADAISTLGFAGMQTEAILGGGLRQTLIMAKANMGGVEASAALAIDALKQFNLVSEDLAMVNQQVTGTLDATKWGFDDYREALAQAGGVAGGLGVDFAEFNAALAVTAVRFASGSDAGTSFKSFLTSLRGGSAEAKRTIEQLGLQFYDAQGKFLGLGNAAQQLRDKITPLSDQSKTVALTNIFGVDGMRTAIGLMEAGREEIGRLQSAIGQTDVGEKLAIQMQGLNQAMVDLANAGERLKIALGDAGLLAVFTAVASAAGGLVGALADLPSGFHSTYLAVGVLAAAIGPLILLFTKVILPIALMSGRLGLLGTAFAAILNPIGLLVIVLGKLILWLGLTTGAVGAFAAALVKWGGIIGIVVTVLALLLGSLAGQSAAMSSAQKATDEASAALSRARERTMQLANAHGALRARILETIAAELLFARINAFAARVRVRAAAQTVEQRRQEESRYPQADASQTGMRYANMLDQGRAHAQRRTAEAQAVLDEERRAQETKEAEVQAYERGLAAPPQVPGVNIPNLGAAPDRVRKPREERDRAREIEERNHRREMLELQEKLAVARASEDHDQERSLQRTIDLKEAVRQYRDLEYSRDEARDRAGQHQAALIQAEALARARNVDLSRKDLELEEARTLELDGTIDRLEQERDIRQATLEFQRMGLSLEEAETEATEQRLILDQARFALRARERREFEADRQIELARLRGDRDELRRRERERDIEERARAIARSERRDFDRATDIPRAAAEWAEREEARLTGLFRETFGEGVRAALDGNFGDWFQRWWTEQLTDSLTEALNSVADLLRDALKGLAANGGGGGGFLGSVVGGLGKLFGLGGRSGVNVGAPDLIGGTAGSPWDFLYNLPRFSTGGSFNVGGRGGVDQNLVSFWATRGEHVNISKGESQRQSQALRVEVDLNNELLEARVVDTSGRVVAQAAPAIVGKAVGATAKEFSRRRLGRG